MIRSTSYKYSSILRGGKSDRSALHDSENNVDDNNAKDKNSLSRQEAKQATITQAMITTRDNATTTLA